MKEKIIFKWTLTGSSEKLTFTELDPIKKFNEAQKLLNPVVVDWCDGSPPIPILCSDGTPFTGSEWGDL